MEIVTRIFKLRHLTFKRNVKIDSDEPLGLYLRANLI